MTVSCPPSVCTAPPFFRIPIMQLQGRTQGIRIRTRSVDHAIIHIEDAGENSPEHRATEGWQTGVESEFECRMRHKQQLHKRQMSNARNIPNPYPRLFRAFTHTHTAPSRTSRDSFLFSLVCARSLSLSFFPRQASYYTPSTPCFELTPYHPKVI